MNTSDVPTKKDILFIINPVSGARAKGGIEEKIEKHLDQSRYNFNIVHTGYHGHATILSEQAVKDNVDVIVAVGGDGSINEIAKATHGTKTMIGIIPFGSGNGLAHHLKIPFRVPKALEIINQYKVKKIDTLKINNELCISIAGVGFDALVAKRFEKMKQRGFQAYFKIILQEYLNYKPIKYKVVIDGKE
jgi:diacylglycerol kinase family enzyme